MKRRRSIPSTIVLFAGAVFLARPIVLAADDVLTRVAVHADRFGALSRQIWENPELGYHEDKSAALLQQELRANGFTVKDHLAGMPTAFTAEWGNGKPVIGIMGEFDALPVDEKIDLVQRLWDRIASAPA